MIKLGRVTRNGINYGIRTIGDGIDIVTPYDEFLEEGVATLDEAIKLIEEDSLDHKYDKIRHPLVEDRVFWPA
jgi:hypothetical protein